MTKHDILEYFKDINHAYNNSNQLYVLSDMIDELLEEQKEEQKQALKREYMRGYDNAWNEIGRR